VVLLARLALLVQQPGLGQYWLRHQKQLVLLVLLGQEQYLRQQRWVASDLSDLVDWEH
jgi:hypothetical protein